MGAGKNVLSVEYLNEKEILVTSQQYVLLLHAINDEKKKLFGINNFNIIQIQDSRVVFRILSIIV